VYIRLYFTLILRLVLACILGGIIGYERERTNRPAGFRTHILVCVGAALIMCTSEFIFNLYAGRTNMDPARLGAQVISGIGFLGAGTIIREGYNVRGLTTAASLWAVSCVGLSVGIGFYGGAVVSTALIYITLILLKKFENHLAKKNRYREVFVRSSNLPGQIGIISNIFYKHGIKISNIDFMSEEDSSIAQLRFTVKLPSHVPENYLDELRIIKGVYEVTSE
jgi:putative Mg2+ transporter-C (MgtC) family protein